MVHNSASASPATPRHQPATALCSSEKESRGDKRRHRPNSPPAQPPDSPIFLLASFPSASPLCLFHLLLASQTDLVLASSTSSQALCSRLGLSSSPAPPFFPLPSSRLHPQAAASQASASQASQQPPAPSPPRWQTVCPLGPLASPPRRSPFSSGFALPLHGISPLMDAAGGAAKSGYPLARYASRLTLPLPSSLSTPLLLGLVLAAQPLGIAQPTDCLPASLVLPFRPPSSSSSTTTQRIQPRLPRGIILICMRSPQDSVSIPSLLSLLMLV